VEGSCGHGNDLSGYIKIFGKSLSDSLCGLVIRVPCYRTEIYCVSLRYELNLYMLCRRK
jgi:hypothetical protein